jgi:hypothetical protein
LNKQQSMAAEKAQAAEKAEKDNSGNLNTHQILHIHCIKYFFYKS